MSLRQVAFGTNTEGLTRTATFGSNVQVGDVIVARCSFENGSDITVAFGNSGTAVLSAWNEIAELDQFDAGESHGQEVAWAEVTGAGTCAVIATLGVDLIWGSIQVAELDEMAPTPELQDSQYDSVTIQNPDGSDMTPTSQPAMVLAFATRWGSPLQTPGVDTAAGFVDGGAGSPYTGTDIIRIAYQRITSTAALDVEFTTTNSGRVFLNGLIFTEGGGGASPVPKVIIQLHG